MFLDLLDDLLLLGPGREVLPLLENLEIVG